MCIQLTLGLAACLGLALAIPAQSAPRGLSLYVAPGGDDSWSGMLAAPNQAGTDGPFATVTRAQKQVRKAKADGGLSEGATVLLREGTYYLDETLTFGPEDSGAEGAPVVYAAWPGEKVELKGSVPVRAWREHEGGIYVTRLPRTVTAGGRFWQLYYEGKRQTLARYPNSDPRHPRTGGFLYVSGVVEKGSKKLLQYDPARLDPSRWSRPTDVRVHIWPWLNWNRNISPLAAVDCEKHILTLRNSASYMLSTGNRFFVQNALEELDAPGEWYYDEETRLLYFRPPDGERPGEQVSVPVLKTLVRIAGDAGKGGFVEHISLRHLGLAETHGGLVDMRLAQGCTIAGCTLTNCGGTVLSISDRSHHNSVLGCDVAHVGGSAIVLRGKVDWEHRLEDRISHNTISNNHVHDVGEGGNAWGAICIWPGCGGNVTHDNVVSHNLVHDTPRQGITFNGFRNIVEYNHVHHTNQEQSDTGAIGMGSRDIYERGSIVRYNYVHDTGGYCMLKPGVWDYPHYCWGVYLDDYTSGVHVYGNLIVRAQRGGVMVHGGQDNVIENNIIVDSSSQQVELAPIDSVTSGRTPAHPDKAMWLMTGTKVLGNIMYYSEPNARLIGGRKWEQVLAESDRNVIWHKGMPVVMNITGVEDGDYWAAWQKMGFDANSVIADPLFVNAAAGDYRLRSGSPALKLGFEQLPIERMGLYASPDRASWPVDDDPWREEHLRYPEGPPVEKAARPRPAPPVLRIARRGDAPIIDGQVEAPEWDWDVQGAKIAVSALSMADGDGQQPSHAIVTHDEDALYVALVNEVSNSAGLATEGGNWGADDGAEICIQDTSGKQPGPVFVIQGYPSGKCESVENAGAPPAAARRVGEAVEYAATIAEGKWYGEWRIPWAPLGVTPAVGLELRFNIGVLKAAQKEWIAWVSTGGAPWHMDRGGKIVLDAAGQ